MVKRVGGREEHCMKIGWKVDTVVRHKDTVGSPVSFLCQFLMQVNIQNHHQGSPLSEHYFIVVVRFCYFCYLIIIIIHFFKKYIKRSFRFYNLKLKTVLTWQTIYEKTYVSVISSENIAFCSPRN